MRDGVVRSVFERLLAAVDDPAAHCPARTTVLDLDRYRSPAELERETAVLFRQRPIVVAHASSLAEHGSFVTDDVAGTPLLVVKDGERVRVFVNACRHRGARLTQAPCGAAKLLTCPYHAWSYRLDGSLMRVPHEEVFGGGLDRSVLGLVELPSEVRHGFVWACLDPSAPLDVARYLGPTIEDDWAAFGLDRYVVLGEKVHRPRANWKLIVIPEAVDRVRVVHRMLAPSGAVAEQGELAKSFTHIDGQVFAKEDLAIAESIQSTLASGALRTMTLGGMEEGMRLWHAARDAALAGG